MKIIYFSHSDIFSNKANVVHVLNMCSAFIKNGHSVKLFVWKNEKHTLIKRNYKKILESYNLNNNFELFNYPTLLPYGNSFLTSYFLTKFFDFKDTDFIIGRNLRACFFSSKKIPIFYETHQPFKYYNIIDRYLFCKLIKRQNFISLITISDYLINDYNSLYFFKNISKLRLRDGSNTYENTISVNKSFSPSVGYIGSLYEGRGIEIILQLSKLMKHITFNIVGGNEEEIHKLKINNKNSNLIFHGYLDYKTSINMMKSFDILLAPYQSNTKVAGGLNTSKWMSPIKLFEYMSAKKPIITSDITSLREFMIHKYNCLIVKKEDNVNEWREAINLILNDKKLSTSIVYNAFSDLKTKYTWDIRVKKIVKNFIKIYKKT